MIIHTPQIKVTKERVHLSANLEFKSASMSIPDQLWYAFPRSYEPYLRARADAFVLALTPIAMALGEDLEVRGETSPKLARGIREYQPVLRTWWPKIYQTITTRYEALTSKESEDSATAVLSSFSGGVDSFYTLREHMPRNEEIPEYRITHCLMINGFDLDMDLDDRGTYRRVLEAYRPVMDSAGVELLSAHTNIMLIRNAVIRYHDLATSYGTILASVALALCNLCSRFYVPSSFDYSGKVLDGSHPITDHLWSTETTEVIHDGATTPRLDKLAAICAWPEVSSLLRVCRRDAVFDETGGVLNCCKCNKCVRTVITLELLGALPRFTGFPTPLERGDILRNPCWSAGARLYAQEIVELAAKKGRHDIVSQLRLAMAIGWAMEKAGKPIMSTIGVKRS